MININGKKAGPTDLNWYRMASNGFCTMNLPVPGDYAMLDSWQCSQTMPVLHLL